MEEQHVRSAVRGHQRLSHRQALQRIARETASAPVLEFHHFRLRRGSLRYGAAARPGEFEHLARRRVASLGAGIGAEDGGDQQAPSGGVVGARVGGPLERRLRGKPEAGACVTITGKATTDSTAVHQEGTAGGAAALKRRLDGVERLLRDVNGILPAEHFRVRRAQTQAEQVWARGHASERGRGDLLQRGGVQKDLGALRVRYHRQVAEDRNRGT